MTHCETESGLLPALLACEPQQGALERRAGTVLRLRRILEATLPGAKAVLVGSVANGLAMAGADLDFELSHSSGWLQCQTLTRLRDALAAEPGVQRCEVILTRSRAPDLLRFVDGQTTVDLSLRHGSGGQSAGVAKAAFVRACSTRPLVRALQLAVKQWAKRRALIDPQNGRLNSFAWALMVIFFVQNHRPELLTEPSVEAATGEEEASGAGDAASAAADVAFWRWLRAAEAGAMEAELALLLGGFFAFWRGFDLTRVASVRTARAMALQECPLLAEAARARVASADARCYLQPSMPALLLEDPAEPDENVARTLAATFEWRAELARAAALVRAGETWREVSSQPRRKRPELAAHWLAGLDGTFPAGLRPGLEGFLAGGGPPKLSLPPMDGGQRLAMHQLADGLGVASKSEGAGATRHVVWYRRKGYVNTDESCAAAAAGGEGVTSGDDDEVEAEAAPVPRQNPFSILCSEGEDHGDD